MQSSSGNAVEEEAWRLSEWTFEMGGAAALGTLPPAQRGASMGASGSAQVLGKERAAAAAFSTCPYREGQSDHMTGMLLAAQHGTTTDAARRRRVGELALTGGSG